VSDCQCQNTGFDPSILRHSGIWGAADEAVLNKVHKKPKKIPLFKSLHLKSYLQRNRQIEFWVSGINGSFWLGRQQVWSIVWLFGPLPSHAFFFRVGSMVQRILLLSKTKNPEPVMVAVLNSETHLLNKRFDFCSHFSRVWLQNLQKMLIWLRKIFVWKN
jgi:hypothetical protein